jgi:phage gpG-like protein
MSMLDAGRNPLGAGLSGSMGIPMRVNFDFFFDRASVQAALDKAIYRGLYRTGSVLMQISRRSIKKMGMAKPKLKVMRASPDATLRQLMSRNDINARTKRKIQERLFEIRFKPPSQPDTPPHTHAGTLRRSITYQYDPSTESVVVGAFMDGAPYIAALHEHGGTQRMAAWAWIPKYDRGYKGILAWYRVGKGPRNATNWQMTSSFRKTFAYPQRPFMFPAMMEGIRRGRIPREFEGRFRVG